MRLSFVLRLLSLLALCLFPWGNTLDADLFVSAASRNSVLRFDGVTGDLIGDFVTPGAGGLSDPQGIAFGPDGNLYVASHNSRNVLRYDGATGDFIDVFATTAGMNWPAEINFRDDMLFVSDFSGGPSGRVSRFDAHTGVFIDHFITGTVLADGQSWDPDGNILISNYVNNSVRKHDGVTGAYLGDFISPGLGGLFGP